MFKLAMDSSFFSKEYKGTCLGYSTIVRLFSLSLIRGNDDMEKIRDIMTSQVESCSLLDNMYEVALKMKELNVGAIPIVDQDKLAGMITDRDIVVRGVAEKHPGSTKVEDIMSHDLITVTPDTTSREAAKLMAQHQIRRLPVVEGDKIVGIVSLGDFAIRELTDDQAKQALSEISESNYDSAQH